MNTRIATEADIDQIVRMAGRFAENSPYASFIDEASLYSLARDFFHGPGRVILLYEDKGLIAGAATPFLFGPGKIAVEIAWWVEPEYRHQGIGEELLEGFEYWAKNVAQCNMVSMVSLDEEVGKFYESKGYRLQERSYWKVL